MSTFYNGTLITKEFRTVTFRTKNQYFRWLGKNFQTKYFRLHPIFTLYFATSPKCGDAFWKYSVLILSLSDHLLLNTYQQKGKKTKKVCSHSSIKTHIKKTKLFRKYRTCKFQKLLYIGKKKILQTFWILDNISGLFSSIPSLTKFAQFSQNL